MKTVLIDGDILIYKAACSAEKENRWPDGVWTYTADEQDGLRSYQSRLKQILEDVGTDSYIMCLSDTKSNFRKHIYPDYKQNRVDKRKPLLLKFLQEHAKDNPLSRWEPHLEADDLMGILATSEGSEGMVIATIDKDLLQIPVPVYDLDSRETSRPSQRNPQKFFMEQVLIGDRVDNYPGCPGVGAKTAEKLLKDATGIDEMWAIVLKQYEKKGLTKQDALVQARCAYILQADHYTNNTITPWGLHYE